MDTPWFASPPARSQEGKAIGRPHSFVFLAFLAVLLTSCGKPAPENELWIIGLDGADWDILDPMIAAGELPHLAALRDSGAYGRLRSDEPMLSPILWTSIATGRTADHHGVTWFMTDGPNGEKIPISSRNRKVRALWNIVSEADQSVGIIGWWATWPVEPVQGFLVSDYVGWHSFGVTGSQLDVPGKVWPADWQQWVLESLPSPDDVDDALLQTMVHLPPDRLGFDASRGPFGGPLPHLRQAVATARGYTDIALGALDRERPHLFAVYYEGTDAVEHLFGQYMPPRQAWIGEDDFAAFRDAVRGYWKYQDQLLGELLAERSENTTVMVVSDHGFRQGSERLHEEQFEIDRADASHMSDGILVVAGPAVKAGTQLRGATIYDVTPTALALMGLPIAEDMQGKVIAGLGLAAPPTVATYETGPWDRGDDLVVDPESGRQMEEMLRSLGYISGGGEGEESGEEGLSGEGMAAENAVNLAVVYKQQGRFDEAITVLQELLQSQPDNFSARMNLAQIYAAAGDFERAIPLYETLRKESPRDLDLVDDFGLTLGHAGRNDEAAKVFAEGTRIDPTWARGWSGLGFARYATGDLEGAQEALEKSQSLDDRSPATQYYLGVLAAAKGESAQAQSFFGRCLELDPGYEDAVLALVNMDRDRGRLDVALQRLLDYEDRAGTSARAEGEIGALYLEMNQPDRALPHLRSALEKNPADAMILSNLGVAQAMTQDLDGARKSFERLLAAAPDSPDAHARMGNFYMQIGNTTAALRELKKARALDAEDPRIALSLATVYHQQRRLADAIPIYEDVIARDPENAVAIYQLAMAVGASGDEARAMQLLERARELDPSLPMPGRQ